MKTFTNSGAESSHDIVHMVGSKEGYEVTNNLGTLTYTGSNRTYVVSDMKHIGFQNSDGTWEQEFLPFSVKASCKEWQENGATANGMYKIDFGKGEYHVHCDMTTDGGGWTRIFFQGYNNSIDTTSVDLLKSDRPYVFTYNVYEEIPTTFESTETLIVMNTGSDLKLKFTNTEDMNNLWQNGIQSGPLVSNVLETTISGKNLISGNTFEDITVQYYSSGAIIGEWDSNFEAGANQWWVTNDSTNINSRFMANGVAAGSAEHYSSILIR